MQSGMKVMDWDENKTAIYYTPELGGGGLLALLRTYSLDTDAEHGQKNSLTS